MHPKQKFEAMLGPYRVLDLTDEKGLLCGKILGDLGADVIKAEKPGGDPARRIGPFYHDEVDPEKSLFWWAYNTNKRGITIDIETPGGRELFKRLVKTADLVIESFPPGRMDSLGLGYTVLEQINPGIILVSITPFGQTGPYRDYKASDIVAWAMGGIMYVNGDADRPPVRVSHHSQAFLHAGGEAASGAMMALYHREITGEGQHVDVSIQEAVVPPTYMLLGGWDMMRVNQQRGTRATSIGLDIRLLWPCKDGYVLWFYWGGPPYNQRYIPPFIRWLDSEGMADDFLKGFDWSTFEWANVSQEVLDRIQIPPARFFSNHTKAQLLEGARERGIVLYPVSTTEDLLGNPQLAAREFWVPLAHPELGITVTYPGAFARISEAPAAVFRRAPLIGEHNRHVYEQELGLSRQEMMTMKRAGVI